MLLVCPKCLTASAEDVFCPSDGTRLVEPSQLPASEDESSPRASISHSPVPLVRKDGPASSAKGPPEVRAKPVDPLLGQLVAGRYRVLSQLGEGGMGNVYRAVQETIEKKVALKVLKAEYSKSPDMVVRFQREAVSACRIKHPNVVDVFDLGQLEDGRFYLAMDLLEGRDLAQLIAATGPLPAARGVHLALQICRALNAAHQSGIVHRDLKPENVFLHRTSDGDEIVKIVDFGIAHLLAHDGDVPPQGEAADTPLPSSQGHRLLTNVGTVFGTPEYMAPEQAQGLHIDHRADIYATGVILYKMFTGHTPFGGSSFLEIIARQINEDPPRMSKVNLNLDIPRELEQVIMHALAKKREDRFENMARFAQAIAYASRDIRRARPRVAWSSWLVATFAFVVVLALGAWFMRRRGMLRADIVPTPVVTAAPREVSPASVGAPAPLVASPNGPSSAIALPSPNLAVSTVVPPSPSPKVSADPVHANVSASPPQPRAGRPGAAEPSPTIVSAPHPGEAVDHGNLPQLERCFETVEGERRQVPCTH